MILFILYILLGCIAGFLSGLLGVGGGLIIVPALIFIFTKFQVIAAAQLMHVVIGTSLASSIVNLISAVKAHNQQGTVRWPVFFAMAPGVIAGSLLLGPAVMLVISGNYLKIAFGIFCLVVAVQMIVDRKPAITPEKLPNKLVMFFLGLATGSISTILGIAGGAITGTVLNYCHMDMRKVVGTTAAICLVIAVSGTLGLIFVGYGQPGLPEWSTGFIYWPALLGIGLPSLLVTPLGAALAYKLPIQVLKKLFAGLVLAIGLKMLL